MPEPIDTRPDDGFADALDAMVCGNQLLPVTDPLTRFASSLQDGIAAPVSSAEREAIWDRLMADRPQATAPVLPAAGGAGSTLTLPDSRLSLSARRDSSRDVRFVPDTGGWMTVTLLIALVALAGAMFAGFGDDDAGLVPTVSATELAPASPVASPQASPAADCTATASPAVDDSGRTLDATAATRPESCATVPVTSRQGLRTRTHPG